jgi:hypothetical protein
MQLLEGTAAIDTCLHADQLTAWSRRAPDA